MRTCRTNFEGATFTGAGAIKLNGAGLAHADLSGSKITAQGSYYTPPLHHRLYRGHPRQGRPEWLGAHS